MTTLETTRFRLAPPSVDDVTALVAHWRGPEVRRYLWDDAIVDLDVVHSVVATSIADHAGHGWGGWVVRIREHPGHGGVIGWVGLRLGPPDGSVASQLLVELLYSLEPAWWGTGAVVEAATAVLDHVFATSTLDEVFAGFDEPNVRSAATLHRLGFVSDREVLLDTGPTPYWRLRGKDWLARRADTGPPGR